MAGGRGGLRVLDVSQAKVPREVGCFHSRGAITTVAAAGDYVLAGADGVLHVLESAYLPEVIHPKTGGAVQPGETGELVLTTLDRIGRGLAKWVS